MEERNERQRAELAAEESAEGESADALDAFMTTVSHNLDRDTARAVRAG